MVCTLNLLATHNSAFSCADGQIDRVQHEVGCTPIADRDEELSSSRVRPSRERGDPLKQMINIVFTRSARSDQSFR